MALLKKDSDLIKLKEPIGLLDNITLIRDEVFYRLTVVTIDKIDDMKKRDKERIIGIPNYVAHDKNLLAFYPAADKNHKVEVKFFPPLKVQ